MMVFQVPNLLNSNPKLTKKWPKRSLRTFKNQKAAHQTIQVTAAQATKTAAVVLVRITK
jgi:hypothetical protein